MNHTNMTIAHDQFAVRCRGVILHEGKLLTVRHAHDPSFAVLPGGHLDHGESVSECLVRELREELGVEAQVGRLLFVHTFYDKEGRQLFEFLLEVTNGGDCTSARHAGATHAHELARVEWVTPTDEVPFRPSVVFEHFRQGTLLEDRTRFISQIKQ